MKRKKWVNKVIALLLAAIMIVPSSLGTVAYAQEPEVSSEQTQTIQNADENISEASEQETTDASQKEQEKKETQDTQGTESKETQKEDSYEVKLSKADNGLLSFPISEDDLVKADVENSTQSILDASEEDVEYESKDSYEENTEVKVQTSADYGYELDKVELEDKSGEVLQELSVDEEGIATFTMPEENVKVAATFKEIPESVIEDAEIDLQTTASDYEIATRAAGTKSIYLNVPGNKIWYGRYNTRYYTTNEGQVAYCMNPLLKTPGAGWYTGSLISDGSSRKAFYYAYGGPGYSQFVNRYGWIWNGVRDLEYAYSHVILSYTYAKYALHNNSQANYAFYGLPNSTKNHLINKANQMQAMGGIPSGYAVYYFNTSYNHQPMAFQVNNVATLSLRKSSSNTDITNGNSCYSLANAKYGVYRNAACTSQVSTFTTNANGTSNSINLEPGTYYVKEISAPEGYYIDNTVKTVSLSSGENKVVSFTDKPMDDPAAIVIQKKDKYTGNTIKGKKTLAGAQFTIKYYDGFYDRNNLPARATRTWVIETKERTRSDGRKVYQAGLSDTYKVGGDNFYKVDGAITIPRGTITIQETKAPDGYRNDLSMTDSKGNSTVNGVYLAQVTKPGDLSTLMGGQTFEGSDSPVRADIKLTKINGTNNNTMANIPFKITNLETKESHTIYTGSNGVYDSSLIKKSLNTNTDKAGAGVWFGDTSILSDDEGSFEYGSYSIEELECKENDGKILYKGTFKIDNNTGATLDLGKIINNSIEVKTYAADNTSGNNNTAFIQQGGIFNYTTGQLTYGKAITDEVNVKGISSGYAVANLVDIETGEYIKNKDGSIVQSEAKIEPYNDGTYTGQAHQNLVYDNPESMLGKNIVVFEKIYALNANGTPNYNKLLVEHTDMNDDLQTVKFQKISTELTVSDTGLHEVNTTSKDVTLQDQITYENFSKDLVDLGYYIKATAKLVDENGNAITDANGKEITSGFSAKKFTSDMLKNGDTIHYTLPASAVKKYAGKKLISQVEIYFAFDTDTTNGDPWNLWTYEKDTTNEKQTVTIPAITNTYVSADNVSYTDTGISDQVNLTGLTRGNTYTLVGKIIDKSTGKVVSKSRKCTYGKDAYDITNVVPADEGNYTVNKLDTYNVYLLKKDVSSSGETAKQGYYRLNDEGTKYVLCTESGQVLDNSNGIKKDLFENEILYPGDEFKEVTELIAKKSFVPSGSESQQNVDFTFDPEELAGKSYVITQDLYFDKLQDAGTVFDDETADVYAVLYSDGTLSFQKRKDTYPSKTVVEVYPFNESTHFPTIDSVLWKNNALNVKSVEFRDGYLTYKAYTAKANIAAPSSSVIISSAKATDGLTVEEILNNDSAFTDPIRPVNEESTDAENEEVDAQNADVTVQSMDDPSGKLLYSHSDLNDENETFYVPKVQTVLTNTANDHYFTTAAGSTLVDTVTYSGLKPGRAYTLTGKLMDKDTGKAATDKFGKEITGTTTFTPSTANGTAKVNFSFDGSNLKGKTLVAYETLNGISVAYGIASSKKDLAIHKDISDADQSVTNMSLSTTAKDQKSGTKQVTLSRTAKIDDTVSYKGAIRGTSYKINGTLMNKSTGEAAVDGDGKPITASGVFTAGSATGTATVTFTFNTNGMAGGAYVAFEEVYETTGGTETLWGTHMDLNDEAQTVYVPSISTNLIDEDSQTNYTYIRDNVKAHDLVTYEGLIAGKTYKLTGTLVEKSTGKTFVDANGKTATITQTFTPDSDSGSVDMVFDINPSNLKTSALVAFETLSCNGEQVTIENDLDNEQQTLHFPILSTTAKGKVSGKNYVDIGGDMSIIDTIKYEGVQYGMTHTIKTYLVDKSTGKTVKDDNGNDIVKTTEWEPEATQGSIDIEIPVTGKKLAGRTLVVFEEIYLGDAMIACHKDINDANQTIKVKGYRDCTVIKRIKADDYWKEHGDPTFIFKLTGTDTLGASHTYYQSVTFTESYVKAHTDSDGYVEMKAIFGQVPAGEYTCSEESVSRFEFESLTKPVNATINGKTAVYHLTDNDTACATFTNKKYEEGDFGHDSVVVNHFNHKTQD